jgi:hypothetical protein
VEIHKLPSFVTEDVPRPFCTAKIGSDIGEVLLGRIKTDMTTHRTHRTHRTRIQSAVAFVPFHSPEPAARRPPPAARRPGDPGNFEGGDRRTLKN